MTSPVVLCEIENRVATITLHRPDRKNAWTPALQRALDEIWRSLADDDSVRAVVLTGADGSFCSGADMEVLSGKDPDVARDGFESLYVSHGLLGPLWFPKPVIAAIEGACAGLGLQLALMCDVRFGARDAKFTTAFSRRGLIAEHGLSWLLPRISGVAVAADLLLSARVFDGAEAERLGVVTAAVDPGTSLDRARAYARDLADNVSPTSMAVIKSQLHHHPALSLRQAVDHSDELMVASFLRDDVREGVASFVERRPVEFGPLDRAAVPAAYDAFDPADIVGPPA